MHQLETKKQKIVLITSGQPSINPRLVKEADLLARTYEVVVIYQYWNDWATEADNVLLKDKDWTAIRVGGHPNTDKICYLFTKVSNKIAKKLCHFIGLKWGFPEFAMSRSHWLLYRAALKQNAHLFIGHNPGALAATVMAATRRQAKCGFDAEDFHRREYSDDPNHPDVRIKTYLENKYFPKVDYLIAASPLIQKEYQKIFPQLPFTTILNVFPKIERKAVAKKDNKIRLFWFSQTIGHNRGLDQVVEAMKICGSPLLELHVLGNPREHVIHKLKQLATEYGFQPGQLAFYKPIPPDEIPYFAQNFDIGLATEIGTPYNRDICLTNKIFTYIQAGLAVIATDTSAQKEFMQVNAKLGCLYPVNNHEALATLLTYYVEHPEELLKAKQYAYDIAQRTYNWETEGLKLQKIVTSVLSFSQ